MGDVIHALPAVTELKNNIKNIIIDWVVEEAFVDIPSRHPAINKVIPIAMRRWRKSIFKEKLSAQHNKDISVWHEVKAFWYNLREYKYDYIIDAQGLLKSAIITRMAKLDNASSKSYVYGLNSQSSRGKYIQWLYHKRVNVPKNEHAVLRLKTLFANIFNYRCDSVIDYGLTDYVISDKNSRISTDKKRYLVFLHCTTWESKKWPVSFWQALITKAINHGFGVKLNSGNQEELQQTYAITSKFSLDFGENLDGKNLNNNNVEVMQPQSINKLINTIANSSGVVCVDTGLGHLAAALSVPGVGIYGASSAKLTAILSDNFINLSSRYKCSPCLLKNCNLLDYNKFPPCYDELNPDLIWKTLETLIN